MNSFVIQNVLGKGSLDKQSVIFLAAKTESAETKLKKRTKKFKEENLTNHSTHPPISVGQATSWSPLAIIALAILVSEIFGAV